MKPYIKRVADEILKRKLEVMGAVLIEGPKWCGKTTTAEQCAGSILYMADPLEEQRNMSLFEVNPRALLAGKTPRLIDEWQIVPRLWDVVRFEVDHRDDLGQFILTGSAVPPSLDSIKHTGTGRIARMIMRPMSLFESGDSTGDVSLLSLFDNSNLMMGESNLTLEDIAFLICRGGWPKAVGMDKRRVLDLAIEYYTAVVESDISRVDNVSRDRDRVRRLMKSYARHQGAQVNISVICEDIKANESEDLSSDTIASYISALRKIFVIEDVEAWNPNLRSKTAIRTSDTRYYIDPSIATAALGLGPKNLVADLNTMGLFFETLCIRDLRVFAESMGGRVYHYRDKTGLECDAVVVLNDGRYGLIEIKLGGDTQIEEGAKTLNKLADRIDTDKMSEPAFKMVLTAVGRYAYPRVDGVLVVPIGCLKN